MSRLFWICTMLLAFAFTSSGQVKSECSANNDKRYDRKKIIKDLGRILNKSIPENLWEKYGVTEDGNRPSGFIIHDLTDTTNKGYPSTCVEFREGHVYHFVPWDYAFSLSHLVILENGKLKIFRSINCKDRGDTIEDVLAYLNQKLTNDTNKDDILERVRNYRKYGKYFKFDNYSTLVCQEVSEK
jgi:hypothetical protein